MKIVKVAMHYDEDLERIRELELEIQQEERAEEKRELAKYSNSQSVRLARLRYGRDRGDRYEYKICGINCTDEEFIEWFLYSNIWKDSNNYYRINDGYFVAHKEIYWIDYPVFGVYDGELLVVTFTEYFELRLESQIQDAKQEGLRLICSE